MGRVVRCVVVVVGLLSILVGTAVADSPFERPAHATREVVGDRTATSRTWEMPSGEHVTQLSTRPAQWRDANGDWHDYDPSLRVNGDGWAAQAGKVQIQLPDTLTGTGDGMVRVRDAGGHVLSMAFLGEASSGTVASDVAAYRDVAPGVDLHLRAVPEGLKEDIVLAGEDASRELSYRLVVDGDDLAVQETGDGGLAVVHGKDTVFVIPPPTLNDAKHAPGPGGRFALEAEGKGVWVVRAVLPQKWLDSSDRAWPVTVDPSVLSFSPTPTDDCGVSMTLNTDFSWGGPSAGCNVNPWRIIGGADVPGTLGGYFWDLLRFDTLTLVQSDAIDSATLHLYRAVNDTDLSVPDIGVQAVSVAWNSTSFPWQAQARGWADRAPAAVIRPGPSGPVDVDMTSLVQEWRSYQTSSGTEGIPNRGVVLNPTGWELPRPMRPHEDHSGSGSTVFTSSTPTAGLPGTVLEVKSWPAAAAGNAVISPGEGDLTGKRVRLQARALASSVSTVRFQYIAGSQRRWTDVPVAALSTPTRGTVSSIDIPVSGPTGDRRSDLVVCDLSAMPGGEVDGPVHVRAWLESPTAGQGGMTDEVNFRLDRRGIDKAPSAPIGPGKVNLLSGEFSTSAVDASAEAFLQDLTLTRTYRSRGVAVRNADMFGSGWESSVEADGGDVPYKGMYNYSQVTDVAVDRQVLDPSTWNWELFFQTFSFDDLQPDIETMQETESFNYEYAIVEASDGTKMTFTQVKDSRGNVTDWTPDDLHPGFALSRASTGTSGVFDFTLTEPSGNVAKFRSEAADSPSYRLSTFQQAGARDALSYTYEASGTRQRLAKVTAPNPTGGSPRSLVFTWGNVGTPSVPRVTSVAFQDGASAPTSTPMTYSYDTNARLIQVTDAFIAGGARNTRYHYSIGGQLDQIMPSGGATWNLAYTRIAGDSGPRLASVSRLHPDLGTATSTIRYGVPLSGSGAPYDMSASETARWGQVDDLPWDAVAIWPQDTIPDARSPDYTKATVYYVGLQGLTVNVAMPGGAISTSEHDARGNVIRELGAQGRSAALTAGANSATVAQDRSMLYQYGGNNVDLIATREPVTQITLAGGSVVTGRRLSTTNYDENAPSGGPYHLPTSEWRAVESGGRQLDVREQVRYDYSGNGGMSGWTARHATKTVVDPGGRALTSYSILHGSYPIVEETRTPGAPGGGSSPDVQWYQYYGITPTRVPAAIQDAQCRAFGLYGSGRLCERSENTTSTAAVPRRWYTYTYYGHVATLNESRTLAQSGATFRATTNNYTASDQLSSVLHSGGAGTANPTTTFTYDPASGQQTLARSTAGTISRTFDSNGRMNSYTDASGTVSRFRYDLRGRQTWMTSGGVPRTYGYDDRDNRTRVDDTGIGASITGTYNLDDQLAGEGLPNGLALMQSYDETGRAMLLSWTQTSSCRSNCVWARSEILNRDADGRTTAQRTNNTQETITYDSAGRLTQSDAVRLADNRCVRRTYAYDGGAAGDSNRTSNSVWTSAPGSACGTGSPTTRTLTYDAADRISSSGWTWDDFGRATSVPAADSGGSGTLTNTYYTDDRVRQLTLDGRTHTYTRDPLDRTQTIASGGASKPTLTSTYRYSDDSDEPTRITLSDSTTTRDIEGPSDDIVANDTNGTITYQLRDLQGSTIAIAPASGPTSASTEYDPFGIVTTTTPNVIDWTKGLPANGWLGAHQRPTDFGQTGVGSAGPIEMGARVYLPDVGGFLQPDPVDGGSLNAYDYAFQDPTNMRDLSGTIASGIGAQLGAAMKDLFKRKIEEVSNDLMSGIHIIAHRCTRNTFLAGTFALGDALRNNWDDVTKLFSRVSNRAGRRAAARTLASVISDIPGAGLIGFTGGCLVG